MLFKSHGMLNGTYLPDTLHRLHRLSNPLTWITLLTVNITGQKQLTKVHADEGGSSDNRDTNNSNHNNDGKDSNISNADDDNNVAISAPNVLTDIQLAKTTGTYFISSHFHFLIQLHRENVEHQA